MPYHFLLPRNQLVDLANSSLQNPALRDKRSTTGRGEWLAVVAAFGPFSRTVLGARFKMSIVTKTVWFLVRNGRMDYGDYHLGLYRDYYRDLGII